MTVQWLLALLVLVGPLPATICTCPAHAHEHHCHHDAGHHHHHDHGDGHCCCHDRTPPDTILAPAAELHSDLDIPMLAWVVVSNTDDCPVGYKFVPFRFARSVPLYISYQTLLN